ncbi:MAG: hypothetical protein J5800_06575 [Spirochaetales bacterium]|nr:hypothetical protein [Spirochaetales bacterium]
MKKTVFLISIILLVCFAVFADTIEKVEYPELDLAFQPTMAKYDAMGQSGLAVPTKLDSFYTNPANLAVKRGFGFAVPSMSVTLYNLQRLIADEEAMEIVNKIVDDTAETEDKVSLAEKYLNNLGSGKNAIAKIDMGMGLQLGSLGLGTNVQVKIHTLNDGSNLLDLKLIPEVNVAETIGLGLKIIDTNALSLSLGASVHAVYKAYFKEIGANDAIKFINDTDNAMEMLVWDTPVMGGWALPVDAGVTLGLADDTLLICATANNLNGAYHMQSFAGAGYLINSLQEDSIEVPEGRENPGETVRFDVETPWELNFGFAFAPDWKVIRPTITADLVDMLAMCQSFGDDNFRAEDLLLHLNLGAEVELLKLVTARVGINRGYMSVGAAVNLFLARIDVSYGWQEFGVEIGDKPVDSLTVKVVLGYDK